MFWIVCGIAGPPAAAAIVQAGYPMARLAPLRDLALIGLWSVAEEIVFRGALQPALARWLDRPAASGRRTWITPSNLLTSALFAAAHLWRHGAALAAGVFPISLVYGLARELSGRWWPAALLHLWFNACLYGASWWLAGAS